MLLTSEKMDEIISTGILEIKRYSIPLFVFPTGTHDFHCGTGTLIQLSAGVALVTVAHVLRAVVELGDAGRLQIGKNRFVLRNVHQRAINFGVRTDLAAMPLSPQEVAGIGWDVLHPDRLAVKDVRDHELVAFIGFPGADKKFLSDTEIELTRHECIAVVQTIERDQFSLRIDEERYEHETNVPIQSQWVRLPWSVNKVNDLQQNGGQRRGHPGYV
jgi:hypothetical protein